MAYLLILVAVVCVFLFWGHKTRCGSCGAWFSLRLAEKKVLYRTKKSKRLRITRQCRKCGRKQGREIDVPLGQAGSG